MLMGTGHLSDGTLRALADRELPLLQRVAATVHLARCRRCRNALEAVGDQGRTTHDILSLLDRPVDSEEGWRRLSARRSQVQTPGRKLSMAASSRLAWALTTVFAVIALALALDRVRGSSPVAAGAGGRQDICCWDLDGGGRSDDGVMTLSSAGELLDCVVLYDDRDRSRSFTQGDAVRYISRAESCAPLAGVLGNPLQLEHLAMNVRDQ
jgi:hypothetical protein